MAIYEVTGPDKRVYEIEGPSGASKEQVLAVFAQHLQANPPPPPKGGFIAAIKGGAAEGQAGLAALGARMGLRDTEGAQRDIEALEAYSARTYKPESKGWMETPWQEFKETLGGSLPYMVAPVVLGAVGAPLGVAGAAGLAGFGSLAQHAGSNVRRQMETGKSIPETNLGSAVTAAVPQAALDTLALRYIPFVSKMFGVTPKVAADIARQTTAQAAKDVAMATGKAATAEGVTETAQQYLERLQADLSTMDPEAREEYLQSFIGGAVLGGTLGVPGRMMERSAQRSQQAVEQRAKDAETLRQQQEVEAQEAAARDAAKKTPEYASQIRQRWDGLSAKEAELKAAIKAVPKGEFAKDDRAQYVEALKEVVAAKNEIREDYARLRPLFAKQDAEAVANAETGPQRNLFTPPPQEPELFGDVKQPTPQPMTLAVEDAVKVLQQQPELEERVRAGHQHLQGLTRAEQRAALGALDLQRRQQEKQAKQQAAAELAQRQADMQAAKPGVPEAHDVSQFMDSTQDVEQAAATAPSSDLEYMNAPPMEDMWIKALGGDKAPPQVAADIKPIPAPEKVAAPVDDLYQQYLAADDEKVKARARQQLDVFAKEGEPLARELVRLRDEQERAYADLLEAIEDVRSGEFLGGKDATRVAGAYKGPDAQRRDVIADDFDVSASRRDALFKKAQEAKQRYIRAVAQEANTRHTAAGQNLSTDTALKNAVALTDKLDEIINRLTADNYRENVPLEERPFAKPRAALDVIREDVHNTTRAFVTPQHKLQRVESPLKRQFPETMQAEDPATLVERALQKKDLAYGVRKSLEKAQEAIKAGNVSGDLLDATKELATRAMRGERVRDPAVMRDLNNAMKALADVQRRDAYAQRELPGVEKTAYERGTPEEFRAAPEVRKARETLDWADEKRVDLQLKEKELTDKLKDAKGANLKRLQARLQRLREERDFFEGTTEARAKAAARRAEIVKANEAAEAKRVAEKKRRDELERRRVRGLDLEGTRRVDGEKEKIKSAEDEEKARAIREMREQAETSVIKKRLPESRAKGPVARGATPKAGKQLTQAHGAPTKRDTVIEADEESQRLETKKANAAAEALKGKPGTELRDRESRGKLETDRAALQAEIAQLATGKEPNEKRLIEAIARLSEVEDSLEPYRKLDVLEAEANLRDTNKKARAKKQNRKQVQIGRKLNEENAKKSRREKAVEDFDADEGAFDDLSGFIDDDPLFRTSTPGTGMPVADVRAAVARVISKWKAHPADVEIVKAASELPSHIADKIVGTVPGVFDPKSGKVYLVADNLANEKDVGLTLAHEIAGHFGLRKVMGDDYARIMKALYEGNPAVRKAADAKIAQGLDRDTAVEEVLAEKAESDPGLLKRLYYAIKSWLAKTLGVKGVSDAEVQQIVDAARRFVETGQGAAETGIPATVDHPVFRTKAYPSVVVGAEPGKLETLKGNFLGLGGRQQLVDRYAPIELVIKKGQTAGQLDANQALAGNFFMRMSEQATQAAGQFLTYGPVGIVKDKLPNGKTQERYRAQQGTTMLDVAKAVEKASKAAAWDMAEAEHALTMLAIGQRADAVKDGWKRVKGNDPAAAKAEYDQVVAKVNANPQAKTFLNEALTAYKKYNDGLMDFLEQTHTISSEEAARLKRSPYVPFYRVESGEVKLFAEGEHGIRIGNIKDNPDLKQMLGDDKAILPIFTSAVQNTFMISRMGLRNKGTHEIADVLHKIGVASKMGKGPGPDGADTIHYKHKGEPYFAVVDSDMYGIPAKMIVMGMEGIKTTIPGWVKAMAMPANWLRTMITRSPAYVVRQLIRDPVNAAIMGAVDSVPVVNALKHMANTMTGKSDEEQELMHGLAISSNIYTGDAQDMTKFIKQIAEGQSSMRKLFNTLDSMALQADSATRASVYEDAKRKGFTEAEAMFRALEIQNFSRRGLSPTMQHLSMVIPFFNAQLQGIDVLIRAFKGDMPFNERLELRRKLMVRGALLMATSLAYASMMQDDEDYKKAKPNERYQNFFLRVPGIDDFVKIPIPFEVGLLFKALPEAIFDAMGDDTKAKEAAEGIARVAATSIPGFGSWGMPAGVAPLMQAAFGQTTWGPIETNREKQLEARLRSRENTSEVAKVIGEYSGELGISPIMFEHFVRGYTGSLGLAALHMLDPMLEDPTEGEKATKSAADQTLVGSLFQRKEGRYLLDRAYDRMDAINKAKKTYEELLQQGKRAEARQYAQEKSEELAMTAIAGMYRQQQGAAFKEERLIRASPKLTQEQKDARIKKIREVQNARATRFYSATERTAHP